VFWKAAVVGDPTDVCDSLAEEDAGCVEPSADVLAFRRDLLLRWPDLADCISPWHTDLDWRQPWGATDLADRFVYLTLPYGWGGARR
jgi:hypothetical protein